MKNPATFRRTAAAVGLVTTALLMIVSTVLAPPFPGNFTDQLAEIDQAGSAAAVSAFAFALAQLPFIVGMLGVGHLLRDRAPLLSNIGTTLAVVGGFGHSVYGGVTMVQLDMAADAANRAVHVEILEQLESGPTVAFMAMGLLGTVLGILLLSIGLFRSRVVPRWVPVALWAFLVVEFVGSNFSDWASSASGVLYVGSLAAIALTIWRSPAAVWQTRSATADATPLPEASLTDRRPPAASHR
jgi:hypothetical protein